MEDAIVNANPITAIQDSLSISLRIGRLLLGVFLGFAVSAESSISIFWQLALSGLAIYTFMTGLNGRDPLLALLRRGNHQMSDQVLDVVAQLECLSIGLICIVAGILNNHAESLVFRVLPFLGIYSILLCAVKRDLLGYLLQSYRKDLIK